MSGARERASRRALAAAVVACGALATTPSRADDVAAAAAAFRQAQAADLKGDRRQAAELYELADSLAAAPQPLRAALRARRAAGDVAIAATRAEALLARYPDDKDSADLAHATLADLGPSLVRVAVECRPGPCVALVDGVAVEPTARAAHLFYVAPGRHEVGATFSGRRVTPAIVDGTPGASQALAFDEPAKAPTGPRQPDATPDGAGTAPVSAPAGAPARPHGLRPAWLLVGAGATAALGATAIWSGLDTVGAHREYAKAPTQAAYEDGLAMQRRTNALLVATGVVGVATGVVAVFFTDWSRPSAKAAGAGAIVARVGAAPGLAGLVVEGTLR